MVERSLVVRWVVGCIICRSMTGVTKDVVFAVLSVVCLLIGKSSPFSGGSGFPLSLTEWSFTVCPTLYNHK